MDLTQVQKVKDSDTYKELVSKRSSFAWTLSIIMLVIYYAFIMIIAFSPETLGTPLGDGITTVGIPIGITIIIVAFALTGIYTKRANTEYDALIAKIKDQVKKEQENG